MKKILYITNRLNPENKNGAYIAANRNHIHLKEIFGEELDEYLIKKESLLKKIIDTFVFNRLDDISIKNEKEIINKIKLNNYKYIFFDGSGYGYCIEKIRNIFGKQQRIITYCHDINYHLFSSLYENAKRNKKILPKIKYGKYIINSKINETKVFNNSNMIITLNERDTKILNQIYDKKSNIEIGVTFPLKDLKIEKIRTKNKFVLLFVGVGTFLPNIEGIEFFIKNVLLNLDVAFFIVGKDTEQYKEKWEKMNSKVKVLGTVNSLDEYYLNADAVIAPIFSGGGMKVKTAEALSYGKTIFGTKEAFEGYEVDCDKVGGLCNTAEEFIEKINKYIKFWEENDRPKFNEYSKTIFKEKYSYESSLEKFEKIFKHVF